MREMPGARSWAERLIYALSFARRDKAAAYLRELALAFTLAAQRLDDAANADREARELARARRTIVVMHRGLA